MGVSSLPGVASPGQSMPGAPGAALVVVVKVITESLGLTDSVVTATVLSKVITESLGLTDSVVKTEAKVKVFTESLGLTDSVVTFSVFVFTTPTEVDATMSATLKQATPDATSGDSETVRLDGTAAAQQKVLLRVPLPVPIGVGATVLRAELHLFKAEAWSGAATLTIELPDEPWDAETATYNTIPDLRAESTTGAIPTGGVAGDEVIVDVTALVDGSVAADDASGSRWYGLLLSVDLEDENRLFSESTPSSANVPFIKVEYSLPPEAPTGQLPSGGRAVSSTLPKLVAQFRDPDAEDTLQAMWVQVCADTGFADVDLIYDSDWGSTTAALFDLDDPPPGAATPAALDTDTTLYWRPKFRDNHSVEGEWGEPAEFQVIAKGSLAVADEGGTIDTPTPLTEWTLTPAGAESQLAAEVEYEVKVDGIWRLHYLFPMSITAATSHQLPDANRLEEGFTYRRSVRVWDDVDREDMAGDRSFLEDQQEFTLTGLVEA